MRSTAEDSLNSLLIAVNDCGFNRSTQHTTISK